MKRARSRRESSTFFINNKRVFFLFFASLTPDIRVDIDNVESRLFLSSFSLIMVESLQIVGGMVL